MVVICLKIRTFVVSATTIHAVLCVAGKLWFAWKFVPLWYQQQPSKSLPMIGKVVICLKIRTFVVSATTQGKGTPTYMVLWFAWKFVPLWYQQQLYYVKGITKTCCDLLENSYLCGISNNLTPAFKSESSVVICLKIRTFVVSATTTIFIWINYDLLWFAWKFVPLWYQQQLVANWLS